jgi:polysaccharide export outer membrane protein
VLLLAGCTTGSYLASTTSPRATVPEPRMVGTGDLLQVAYFLDQGKRTGPYRIGPGDALRISIADQPELSREEVVVLPDGRISLNMIGSVIVGGKTVDEVAAEVAAAYRERKIRKPDVVVSVTRGQQRVRTFLQSLGWGLGSVSRIEVRVLDQPSVDLPLIPPVVVGRPFEEIRREIKEAYVRQFGEELHVTVNLGARPQTTVAVMGEVKKPGSIEGAPGIDLVTALAMAGGFTDAAQPKEVLVLRLRGDGAYERWLFDVGEESLAAGGAGAFRLEKNDVVYVGKSAVAKMNLFVEQYIKNMLPVQLGVGGFVPLPVP